VPDSSNSAALGYAEASGLPFELGLIRNHYVGRTFISPSPALRANKANIKYNPVREILEGKRVVVVDDSIVRGTTSRRLVRMLRSAGAREVHFRVSSPPIRWPCYYGIDTPTKSELIAATHSVEEIARYIGVDSLAYLSMENLRASGGYPSSHYCTACFDGSYAVPWDREPGKDVLENRSWPRAAEPAVPSPESA
jgi:amidophosphoribosyltransferase